jgi:retron-type reverse transcriptase
LAVKTLNADELDKERRSHCYVRYAGDVNIFVKSSLSAQSVKESVTRFIEDRLLVRVNKVNKEKSRITQDRNLTFQDISFTSVWCERMAARSLI